MTADELAPQPKPRRRKPMGSCSECPDKARIRGMCLNHYRRWLRRASTRSYNPADDPANAAARLRYAKALGEELRARGAHDAVPGSLGHELALEAAGRAAEARCRM